jgi:hypothetical protein
MSRRRPVWGFRLVGREIAGLPTRAHTAFISLREQLSRGDVLPDDVWRLEGRQLWIYNVSVDRRTYRMAVELMPGGWVMVWGHGPASLFRTRLRRRLGRLG